MIYRHVNKRTKILALATSHIAQFMQPVKLCLHCQFLYHVLKALIFIKTSLKLSYFRKKMQNFLCSLGSAPRASSSSPPAPQNIPPLQIFDYTPGVFIPVMLFCVN